MSIGTNVVKITAKTALKGNWVKATIACMVLIFTVFISSNIAGLLSVVTGNYIGIVIAFLMTVFLTLPIFLGVLRYIWRMLFSACDSPVCVFYWFSSKTLYVKAMKFIMLIVLRFIFWLTLLNIPTLLLFILSKGFVFDIFDISMPLWTANLSYYIAFLENASVVITIFLMLKYYMAPLLFVADDNIDANEAMHMSTVISRKTSIDFVYLCFSFFGWILLSILVIPLLFTLPYMLTSYAVHIRFAVSEYNRHIEEMYKKDFSVFTPGV